MDAVYRLEGMRAIASPRALGPWGPSQHGGAPASLITHIAETLPSPQPMRIARLTIDLMRPVPIAPLNIATEVVREGRKIRLIRVELSAEQGPCVVGTVLQIRREPLALPDDLGGGEPVTLPGPEAGTPFRLEPEKTNFSNQISMRVVRGAFFSPGPSAVWMHLDQPIVEGQSPSRVMRAAIASDFCNGASCPLPFKEWTFINGDLTVSLARDPVDDWILLDCECWVGPDGGGLGIGKLADRQGYFGRAIQSLVIEPRR